MRAAVTGSHRQPVTACPPIGSKDAALRQRLDDELTAFTCPGPRLLPQSRLPETGRTDGVPGGHQDVHSRRTPTGSHPRRPHPDRAPRR
ncbi:hypothetical protein ACH4S8_18725 [Streptomyces sp. NPDC021080]|uniref:hypothetical protein n=1 Tax=Streptomyces sp. NPDC021080 TaxID=3365110 RepID=UPI003790CCDF